MKHLANLFGGQKTKVIIRLHELKFQHHFAALLFLFRLDYEMSMPPLGLLKGPGGPEFVDDFRAEVKAHGV